MTQPSPPTDTVLTSPSAAVDAITELVWPDRIRSDRIGLEIEALPMVVSRGTPVGRLPLHGDVSVFGVVEGLSRRGGSIKPPPGPGQPLPTSAGGQITFEPGGQIEHSTAPYEDTGSLNGELDAVWDELTEEFHTIDVCLVCLGVDQWHGVDRVPQQQTADRYKAMHRYFAGTWPTGAVMMRNTCSIQVNLEAGNAATRQERWLAANLISPLLTAMFATSPGEDSVRSTRALAWQNLDPTRTGLPSWRDAAHVDPVEDTITRVLNASVMYINRDQIIDGRPGWTFFDWVQDGHPAAGAPTKADLQTHLSTLFPEVRPRGGMLELRAIDGMPRSWWMVPAVITAALLYDDHARGQAIEVMSRHAGDLAGVWRRAAVDGVASEDLKGAAEKLGRLAFEAACRDSRFHHRAITATERFLDRFTLRGLSPADELAPLLHDPSAALLWAAPECSEVGRP